MTAGLLQPQHHLSKLLRRDFLSSALLAGFKGLAENAAQVAPDQRRLFQIRSSLAENPPRQSAQTRLQPWQAVRFGTVQPDFRSDPLCNCGDRPGSFVEACIARKRLALTIRLPNHYRSASPL